MHWLVFFLGFFLSVWNATIHNTAHGRPCTRRKGITSTWPKYRTTTHYMLKRSIGLGMRCNDVLCGVGHTLRQGVSGSRSGADVYGQKFATDCVREGCNVVGDNVDAKLCGENLGKVVEVRRKSTVIARIAQRSNGIDINQRGHAWFHVPTALTPPRAP
jgi:hypothetical protein